MGDVVCPACIELDLSIKLGALLSVQNHYRFVVDFCTTAYLGEWSAEVQGLVNKTGRDDVKKLFPENEPICTPRSDSIGGFENKPSLQNSCKSGPLCAPDIRQR